MNKKLIALFTSAVLLALPVVSLAIDPTAGGTPSGANISVSGLINKILDFVWPLFIGFSVIMFLVAGFLFLTSQGDPTKVQSARQAVLWGVVGVVIGIIAFSIPLIIRNTLGLGI